MCHCQYEVKFNTYCHSTFFSELFISFLILLLLHLFLFNFFLGQPTAEYFVDYINYLSFDVFFYLYLYLYAFTKKNNFYSKFSFFLYYFSLLQVIIIILWYFHKIQQSTINKKIQFRYICFNNLFDNFSFTVQT
jgi:hypothetical protein